MSAPPPHIICLSLPSTAQRACKEMFNSLLSPQPVRHFFFFSSTSSTSVMYFTRQLAASGDLLIVLSWWVRTWFGLGLGLLGLGLGLLGSCLERDTAREIPWSLNLTVMWCRYCFVSQSHIWKIRRSDQKEQSLVRKNQWKC